MNSLFVVLAALVFFALPFVFALRELFNPSDAGALKVHAGNAADANDFAIRAQLEGRNTDVESLETDLLDSSHISKAPCLESSHELRVQGTPAGLHSVSAKRLRLLKGLSTSAKLSAEASAYMEPGVSVQVLQAPVIETFPSLRPPTKKLSVWQGGLTSQVYGAIEYPEQGWWRASELAAVLAGTLAEGDIISQGGIRVEVFAEVKGSLKAKGHVHLFSGAKVSGNVLCDTLTMEEGVQVRGCVIVARDATVDRFCTIGEKDKPASLTASKVALSPDVKVYGGIYAVDACNVVQL